jgi:hypothetical protein
MDYTVSVLKELEKHEPVVDTLKPKEVNLLKKRLSQIEKILNAEHDTALEDEKNSILRRLAPPKGSPKNSFCGVRVNEDSASFFLDRLSVSQGWQTDPMKILLFRALHVGVGNPY